MVQGYGLGVGRFQQIDWKRNQPFRSEACLRGPNSGDLRCLGLESRADVELA